jgi:aminotransferase
VLLLSDEVYDAFRYEAESVSLASLPRARLRTLTINSVSKSHALASTRVGWLAAHRHLLRPCRLTASLRSPFIPHIAQMQALAALRGNDDAFEHVLHQFDSRRRYVQQRLEALGFETELPAGGLFFWLRVPNGWESGQAFVETLQQVHRVRVLPGDLFGPSGRRHVRLSYVTDDGRLEEGLSRIGDLLRGPRQRRALIRAAG